MPAATPASPPPAAAQPPKSEPVPAKAEERKAEPAKPAPAPAAAKGEAMLQFRFAGDSWVEVRDVRDKVVFQKLNPADSDATVTGRLPLHVIVGNAEEVRLRYNGRDFSLAPYTKVAVARFTLE
jgi:cytoskeleton protein RodZ